MSHSHGHSHGSPGGPEPYVARAPRVAVWALLVLAAVASLVGVVGLWPDGDAVDALSGSVDFAADGVSFPQAAIDTVHPACPLDQGSPVPDGTCGTLDATIAEGRDDGRQVSLPVPPEVTSSGLQQGDRVEVQLTPATDGQPGVASYFGTPRGLPLGLLLVVFVVVVVAVARLRGVLALGGLAFSGAVLGLFVLPALLTGGPAVAVALAGATAIMFVVLPTTHGFSMRTATALLGTLAGVGVTALVGHVAVGSAHLTGVSGEGGGALQTYTAAQGGLDFQGLLVAAILVAGLGVLNDVTITQASAVWELRGASPDLTRRQVFASAMRIGRDHIASTIYTIVFAYAGTALVVLLVISLYDRPLLDLVGTEELSEEVVRSLASSIGLVLAVPLTTAIAALTVGGAGAPARSRPDKPGKRRA